MIHPRGVAVLLEVGASLRLFGGRCHKHPRHTTLDVLVGIALQVFIERFLTALEISRLRVIRVLARAGYSQMAILRMLLQFDRGDTTNLRQTLDTPAPDDDLQSAADRWLTTLTDQEQVALRLIDLVEDIIHQRRIR